MTRRFLVKAALFGFIFAAAMAAGAQEQQFTNVHCSLTPPLGWGLVPSPGQPNLMATYRSADGQKLLMLFAGKQPEPGPLNDLTIAQFERGRSANGNDERVSGKTITVGGVKAYERFGRSTIEGRPATTWVRLFAGNGFFYSIQAMRFDGNAWGDVEIRDGMDSLRFAGGPVMSKGAGGPGLALLVAVVVTVAIVVLIIVVRIVRKKPRP